jgi:hypothetical protein
VPDGGRYLSKSSVPCYVHIRGAPRLPGEPEAVDEDIQDRFTADAHRRAAAEWEKTERRINSSVDHFVTVAGGHLVDRELRALRRASAAVGRRLGT